MENAATLPDGSGTCRSPEQARWAELRDWRVWAISLSAWSVPAALLATQQWAELSGTPKEMSWARAFAYQGLSWMLLVPATPALLAWIRSSPLSRGAPRRLWSHLGTSVAFGVLFLWVAAPVRHLFHPSPIRWTFFGEAFYKSAPQFILMGSLAYWLVVLVASLLESRTRVHAMELARADGARAASEPRVELRSVAGKVSLPIREIGWIESSSVGAKVFAGSETYLVRHTLAELLGRLGDHGIVRVHRSRLLNAARVREVIGGKGRDAVARLDTGEQVRVSRRMRENLDCVLRA